MIRPTASSVPPVACIVVLALTVGGCAAVRGYEPRIAEAPPEQAPPAHVDAAAAATGHDDGRPSLRSAEQGASVEPVARPASIVVEREGEGPDSRTVDLRGVMAVAATNAAEVMAAAARLEAAAGRAQEAAGSLLPAVSLEAGVSRHDGRQVGSFGEARDVTFSRYEPAARLSYSINPGAALARTSAARRDADAAALDVHDARRLAMLAAAHAYLNLVLTRESMEIAADLERDGEQFHSITEARAHVEVGPGSDVARAAVELAGARQVVLRARARWEAASIRLATLLRWHPGQRLMPADSVAATMSLVDGPDRRQLGEQAVPRRPDLQAAEARARAATARVSARRWELLGPEVDAGVAERFLGTDDESLDDTFLGYALLRLSFDFGELGRLREAVGEARERSIEARVTSERVRAEIEGALAQLNCTVRALPEAEAGADAAGRNQEIQLARFEAGTGLGIEVIEAQNARARARLALVESVLRHNSAQLRLLAAVGHLRPDAFGGTDEHYATTDLTPVTTR